MFWCRAEAVATTMWWKSPSLHYPCLSTLNVFSSWNLLPHILSRRVHDFLTTNLMVHTYIDVDKYESSWNFVKYKPFLWWETHCFGQEWEDFSLRKRWSGCQSMKSWQKKSRTRNRGMRRRVSKDGRQVSIMTIHVKKKQNCVCSNAHVYAQALTMDVDSTRLDKAHHICTHSTCSSLLLLLFVCMQDHSSHSHFFFFAAE